MPVELLTVADSSALAPATFLPAMITENVNGPDGKLAIPANSPVVLVARDVKDRVGSLSEIQLGLFSINVAGHQYVVSDGVNDPARVAFTEDSGLGPAHSTVHLQYGFEFDLKIDRTVQLH